MNEWVMQVMHTNALGDADGVVYVESFDVEAFDGRGFVNFTRDVERAFRWPSMRALTDDWQKVPDNRPKRDDGRPNKPMTALTIAPTKIEEDK